MRMVRSAIYALSDRWALGWMKRRSKRSEVGGSNPVRRTASLYPSSRPFEVNFRSLSDQSLSNQSFWHLVRAVFAPPEGASRPVVVKADCPPRPTAAENGLVTVSFDVDQSG